MSLEKAIEANTAAVEALTAALKAGGVATNVTADAAPAKGRGRPAGSTNKPKEDDGLGDDLDGGDGLDDGGLEEEAPAYDFDKDIRPALVAVRDHGGDKKGTPDVKAIMAKFGVKQAGELKEFDQERINEVAAHIKALAAKKKIPVKL